MGKANGITHNADEIMMMLDLAKDHVQEVKNMAGGFCAIDDKILLTTQYAFCYIGKWYKWGSGNPSGFDCSRFTGELLKMNGYLPRGSVAPTAQGQWDMFIDYRIKEVTEGCFVCFFNGNTTKIGHIEYCINDKLSMGASGGGSKTLTEKDAIRDNAFIKIRPIERGRKIAGYFNPFIKEVV